MRFLQLLKITLALSFFMLTACNEADLNSSSSSVGESANVFLSKGPVTGATCNMYSINDVTGQKDKLQGTSKSENGELNFEGLNFSGLAIVECQGGTYTDEATGVENTPAPNMNAVVSFTPNSRYSVTPLTELAYRLAKRDNDFKTAISTHNANVASQFGLDSIDITTVKPADLNTEKANSDQAGDYGMVLAALSQMVADGTEQSGEGSALEKMLKALEKDLSEKGFLDTETKNNFTSSVINLASNSNSVAGRNTNTETIQKAKEELVASLLPPSAVDSEKQTYQYNTPIRKLSFENDGGALLLECSTDITLPEGLSIVPSNNKRTCEISGTPSKVQPTKGYQITLINSAGESTANVDIEVVKAVANIYSGNDLTRVYSSSRFIQKAVSHLGTGLITYQSSNPAVARVHPTTAEVTILGAGHVVITATQAADDSYATTSDSYQLNVSKALNMLNAGADISKKYADSAFTQTALSAYGSGEINYTSSHNDVATVNLLTGEVTIVGIGQVTILATQAADNRYLASSDSYLLTVDKAVSNLNSGADQSRVIGDAKFTQIALSTGATGDIRYKSSNEAVATVNATTGEVSIVSQGVTHISATIESDVYYMGGSSAYQLVVQGLPTEEQNFKNLLSSSEIDTHLPLFRIVEEGVFKGFLFEQTILGKKMQVVAMPLSAGDYLLFAKQNVNSPINDVLEIANNALEDDHLSLANLGFVGDKVYTWASVSMPITQNQLPAAAKAILSRVYGDTFSLNLAKGLALHTTQNLDLMPEMKDSLDFMNATKNRNYPVQIPLLEVGQNIANKALVNSINYSFDLSQFNLHFGFYIHLDMPLTPTVTIYKSANQFTVTFNDKVNLPFDQWVIPMDFSLNYSTSPKLLGEKRISMKFVNSGAWKAFGADWLTMSDFRISLNEIPNPPLVDAIIMPALFLQLSGTSSIANKGLTLKNEVLFAPLPGATPNVVVPRPSKIGFVIHDGYGKVGGVTLKEVVDILDYMFTSIGIDAGLVTNLPFPEMAVVGVLPEGQSIATFEDVNNHPVGPNFDLFFGENSSKPEGFNLSGAVTLFDEPILTVDRYQVSPRYGIQKTAYSADAYRVADLFDFPTYNLDVDIPGIQSLLDIAAEEEVNASLSGIGAATSQMAALIESIKIKMSGVSNVLGTQGTQVSYEIGGLTGKAELDLIFGEFNTRASISSSLLPWEPETSFKLLFDSEQLTAGHVSELEGLVGVGFSKINEGISSEDAALEQAEADLASAQAYLISTRAAATARKNRVEKPIEDARNFLTRKRNDLSRYDHNAYFKYSSKRPCKKIWLIGKVCGLSERQKRYIFWKSGRGLYTAAIWSAEQALSALKASINIIPVEAYPEVIAAKALVLAAEANVSSARDIAKALATVASAVETAINFVMDLAGKFSESVFSLTNLELYGGLGLDNRLGVDVTATILGEEYQFDFGVNYDITYMRDNFADWMVDNVWPVLSDIIVDNTVQQAAAKELSVQEVTVNAPTGTIPHQELQQDNSKDCSLLGGSCYSLDISSYITDPDIGDVLSFQAQGLPKGLSMDVTGKISGMVTRSELGVYPINVWVTDKTFARLDTSFNLSIVGVNNPHSIRIATQYTEVILDELAVDESAKVSLISTYARIRGDAKNHDFTEFAKVIVDDLNLGEKYQYEIVSGNNYRHFSIDNTGVINLTPNINYNIQNSYQLIIRVTDTSNLEPKNLVAETSFDVYVQPVIWLKRYASVGSSDSLSFYLHYTPVPNNSDNVRFNVTYQEKITPLATDNPNAEPLVTYAEAVIGKVRNEFGDFVWSTFIPVDLTLVERFNGQLDREIEIELLSVDNGAYLKEGEKKQTLSVVMKNNLGKLNDTGITKWGEQYSNDLLIEQPSVPMQDADITTGNNSGQFFVSTGAGFNFRKLDINGFPLPDTATDWACIEDQFTGFKWVSRERLKLNLGQDLWPRGWRTDDVTEYGLSLNHASFGVLRNDTVTVKTDAWKKYCGSWRLNIPTVSELQGIINYGESIAPMVDKTYFSDIKNQPYLALKMDYFNAHGASTRTGGYVNAESLLFADQWLQKNRVLLRDPNSDDGSVFENTLFSVAWNDATGSAYLGHLQSTTNTLIDLPIADTPVEISDLFATLENKLSKVLASVDMSSGTITDAQTNYVLNTSKTTPIEDVDFTYEANVAPYYKGEVMYVIYPDDFKGQKEEDLSSIVFNFFHSYYFVMYR